MALLVLGFALAAAGMAAEWVRFPFSPAIGGWSVPFTAGASGSPMARTVASQGGLFGVLMLLALLAQILRRGRLRRTLAQAAIVALVYYLAYLAVVEGLWLQRYVAEGTAFLSQKSFLGSHFVPNSGDDLELTYLAAFEYFFPDRLIYAWEALGRGWLLAFAGACLVAAAPAGAGGSTWKPHAITAALALAMLALFALPPMWADHRVVRAERQLATGSGAAALESLSRAMAVDPVIAGSDAFMRKVSRAHYAAKGEYEPYAALYLAAEDLAGKAYDAGIVRLETLKGRVVPDLPYRSGYLAAAARAERVLYVARGLDRFKLGDFAGAERDFLAALAVREAVYPVPVDVVYMAARAEMDLRQYDRCVARAEHMLSGGQIAHRTVLADLHSTAGDCYARMREYGRAREAYFESFSLDKRTNYRAYQGLSGS